MRDVLRLNLNESKKGFFRWGGGGERVMSFRGEGPKTDKPRKPTVESLAREIWRLRVSEAEQNAWEGV